MAGTKVLLVGVMLIALAILGSACEPIKKGSAFAGTYPITKEYQLEARQFGFTPNEIRVPAGTRIRLVVFSADVDHQLAVAGISVERETLRGRRQTLEFVAWPPGTYEIACAVVCGAGHDRMKGTLVVE